ncbi:MAG: hypothetical protein IT372_10935 [Polyangiaceae bacterium]|nr:hypothetical protein [Polyangiaceae bacterium]
MQRRGEARWIAAALVCLGALAAPGAAHADKGEPPGAGAPAEKAPEKAAPEKAPIEKATAAETAIEEAPAEKAPTGEASAGKPAAEEAPAEKKRSSHSREKAREGGDASPSGPGSTDSKAADTDVKRVKAGAHIEVRARDVRLDGRARDRLSRIAARYFKATRHPLVITGGTRSPARQAELMHAKLENGEDIAALYENRSAAVEIRDVYKDAMARKLSRKARLRAIRDRIVAQIAQGRYVSKHLKAGAIDVRSRTMTPAQVAAFKAAVAEEPGVVLLDERKSTEPHFHLSL